MNASEAKAVTYAKRPPVRPSQALYDHIAQLASEGKRSASPCDLHLSEENEWWLADEGYTFTTVDNPVCTGRELVVRIHW